MALESVACVLGVCVGLLCFGCATYDPSEAGRGCAAYALGACQSYARCSPMLLNSYGSLEGCQTQLADACTYSLQQPDVLGTGEGAQACGELMLQLDCTALWNAELPLGCQPPAGRRGDGAACTVSAQCASTRCKKATTAAPRGTCEEPVGPGEPCLGFGDCQYGLLCGSGGTCTALAAQGQACDGIATACRAPLVCLAGLCAPEPPPPSVAQAPQIDPQTACESYAHALCSRLQECSKALVRGSYGSLEQCNARTALACSQELSLPDTVSSAAGLAGCAAALDGTDCSALLGNAWPEDCRVAPGARQVGQPCASDAQCASTRCAHSSRSARCGVCAERASAEQACTASSDCAYGQLCAQDDKCREPAASGAACDASHACRAPLVCAAGSCQAVLGEGQSCEFTADRCDAYAGLSCDYLTNQCRPWLQSAAGQPCGYTVQGLSACTAGATCKLDANTSGQCEAPTADGQACQPEGPACLPPARCADGICTLGSGGDCP